MTLIINIGRRVPKSWFKRQANTIAGLISFQENMWIIIKQAFNMAKKQANASKKCKYVISYEMESEDLNYNLQWMKILVQSTPEIEKEEHEISQKIYQPLAKIFKKDLKDVPSDNKLKAHFKTKMLNLAEVDDAYKKGYGAVQDNNISQKLLDMGILTHIKLIEDYDSREIVKEFDF
jgi:hypothetical protein